MSLNAARDRLLDDLADAGASTTHLRELANAARGGHQARASDPDCVKCPRCWDWHTVRLNFGHLPEEEAADPELAREKLCDECQRHILSHHPEHPGAPHIRAALEHQRRRFTAA